MWNYRIVRTIEDGEPLYCVQEVYYDGKGRPWSYCGIAIQGKIPADCIKDVAWIMAGITESVLDYPKDFNGNAPSEKKSKRSKGESHG